MSAPDWARKSFKKTGAASTPKSDNWIQFHKSEVQRFANGGPVSDLAPGDFGTRPAAVYDSVGDMVDTLSGKKEYVSPESKAENDQAILRAAADTSRREDVISPDTSVRKVDFPDTPPSMPTASQAKAAEPKNYGSPKAKPRVLASAPLKSGDDARVSRAPVKDTGASGDETRIARSKKVSSDSKYSGTQKTEYRGFYPDTRGIYQRSDEASGGRVLPDPINTEPSGVDDAHTRRMARLRAEAQKRIDDKKK